MIGRKAIKRLLKRELPENSPKDLCSYVAVRCRPRPGGRRLIETMKLVAKPENGLATGAERHIRSIDLLMP